MQRLGREIRHTITLAQLTARETLGAGTGLSALLSEVTLFVSLSEYVVKRVGRDSSVDIATRYVVDGPGIESADPSGRAV